MKLIMVSTGRVQVSSLSDFLYNNPCLNVGEVKGNSLLICSRRSNVSGSVSFSLFSTFMDII